MKAEETVMGKLASFVIRFRWIVLSMGIVCFVLSLIAANNIEMKTEIKDLLPEDNPQIKNYTEIDDLFAGGSNIIVTIEGEDKHGLAQCADSMVEKIKASSDIMKMIRAIDLQPARDFIEKWGLMLQKESDLERTGRQFAELNLLPFLRAMNDSFEETYTGDSAEDEMSNARQEKEVVAMLGQMDDFFTGMTDYLNNPGNTGAVDEGRVLAETMLYGNRYNYSPDNSMLMFTIVPNFNSVEFEKIIPMMDELRLVKEKVESEFPGMKIAYTGDVPIQADEQDALSFDMMIPALVAVGLIFLLFIFSFDQLRSIVLILISLVAGVVFNYGFLGITVKEINMLTSIMAVLLIGLGVDYGIQIVTNFNTYRIEGHDPESALKLTYTKAGMGIFLAVLTTAIAFFVMAVTGSIAFAQFGMVLGTGILLCFLSMFFILPSLLIIFGKKSFSKKRLPNLNYRFLAVLGKKAHKYRSFTLIAGVLVTAGLIIAALFMNRMEYDMMALEPQDMPSVVQYKKIMDKYEITPFQSMVVADSVEEARGLAENLEDLYLVGDISTISDYLPPDDEQETRLARIKAIHDKPGQRFSEISYTGDNLDELLYEIQRFEWNIIEMGDLSVAGLGENNKIVEKRNELVREIFGAEVGKPGKEIFRNLIKLIESDRDVYGRRLTELDAGFAPAMAGIVDRMTSVDRYMTIGDLPESVRNTFLDDSGKYNLVTIYPRDGVFDNITNIERFNEVMAEVSPKITGMTQITTAWLSEATSSTMKAGIYISLAILIFLLISFRSIRYTLLAMAPLVIGMIWMLGIYPLAGMKLNIVNIIVIPLVIGMGIDFGIHLAHRFQVEQDIDAVYRYTGKAVFLSALTTMIGFGSLGLIGKFPSMSSMGMILFIGIASCLAASLLILPALFRFENNESKRGETQ